jgi:hypothetical protein
LADPAGSGILTVGSGMAGEFGGTPASLSISHDDILNPARCLLKQQPRDPQFERATAGALSPSLAKVHPSASTSAIQPQPFRESMSNMQRHGVCQESILSLQQLPLGPTCTRSRRYFFLSHLINLKQNCNVQIHR